MNALQTPVAATIAPTDSRPLAALAPKNILMLTDFSDASKSALDYAAELTRQSQAMLHIAHMVWVTPCQLDPSALGAAYDWMTKSGTDGLREIAESETLRNVPHRVYLEQAEVRFGLECLIAREHIDLVIIATGGRQGMQKLLMGSVAEEVFRNASCPVITLGPRAIVSCPEKVRRVLFPTDYGPAARRAEVLAMALAEKFGAELTMMHVIEPTSRADETADRHREALNKLQCWAKPESPARFAVAEGEPAEAIVRFAKEAKADLIVLGPRRGNLWTEHTNWATAYKVVCEAGCPVATVRG